MKKTIAFISTLLVAASAMFADVTVKRRDDGKFDVTFFYGNPRATQAYLVGDFTNWDPNVEAMTKTDKGFTLTKTVNAGTVMKYKFFVDGNWTEDLKEPDKVDDGFGGHNGLVDVDALGGGGDVANKPSVKFMSWTMLGTQSSFSTQGAVDKTKKGLDFDSQTVGFKSYNKLTGQAMKGLPFYVEIALAEREMEKYAGDEKLTYIAKKDDYGNWEVDPKDGLKKLASDIVSAPVEYLSGSTDNSAAKPGPGTNPFLGHLKFGFDTPWVNYYTGFNYAKMDVRQAITWKTIDGNWDAGYNHMGGVASFSAGEKLKNILSDSGVTLDLGFIPNKTADRKGTKYGYIAWAGAQLSNDAGDFAVDFQSNGAYDGEYIFDDAVEHDFILGTKGKLPDYGITYSAQALLSTHQKSTEDLCADGASGVADWSGYSTDIWARDTNLSMQNIAANAQFGYEDYYKVWGINAEYRMRGAQASMLYLRQNHDDGTFDLSETLGVANSQRVKLDGYYSNEDIGLKVNLEASCEMPLQKISATSDIAKTYAAEAAKISWYAKRFGGHYEPFMTDEFGMEFAFTPTVSYTLGDTGMSFTAYGDFNYSTWDNGDYACSDSPFAFKRAGLTFNWDTGMDVMKALEVYYGCDNSNGARMWNTLTGQVTLPQSMKANLSVGLRTVKNTDAGDAFDEDVNNIMGFAMGWSKQFTKLAKPVLYTQFVYNMDPYKHFGDGQDQLNLDRANLKGSNEKEGDGMIDPVDWYDGKGAFRVGVRWEI